MVVLDVAETYRGQELVAKMAPTRRAAIFDERHRCCATIKQSRRAKIFYEKVRPARARYVVVVVCGAQVRETSTPLAIQALNRLPG
jgi:hypothetical protein